MKKIEKFEGTLALYTLRAIDKLIERLQRDLNTVAFTDPVAPAATTIRDADAPRTQSGKGRKQKA
jgi:hypothetical protein